MPRKDSIETTARELAQASLWLAHDIYVAWLTMGVAWFRLWIGGRDAHR